ncbi:MAG: glycolate oxidase subunit GlcF [Nitrosomonas sp.]|nr:glycolate oxidase subunit GlcF [Nitrosomonas sp.]
MQTQLEDGIRNTPAGKEADAILRSCVHCGFCLATCPTYQLLGDELDSPRGRIYLIKQLLEGAEATQKTQRHLDRCLTCRACETTCPSGVQYGRLLDIGRHQVEQQVERRLHVRLIRYALRKILPNRRIFVALMTAARIARPLMPAKLKKSIPPVSKEINLPVEGNGQRVMLVLDGCVQPVLKPAINLATSRVLKRVGIDLVSASQAGCCGALAYHLNAQDEGLDAMRRNIDAWWPYVVHPNKPAEAIVITASGCGVTIKEYGHLLRHDDRYAEKAARISALAKDIGEVMAAEKNHLATLMRNNTYLPHIAFHSPCTLQHGMRLNGVVEELLQALGFKLARIADAHLCCGSAGTYSLLQPQLSRQLRDNKLAALCQEKSALLATANIGCLMHLQAGTDKPVKHWIELLDEALP